MRLVVFIIFLVDLTLIYPKDPEPVFKFAIFSDNAGDGLDKAEFVRMNDWIKAEKPEFIIGVGDHVKKRTPNKFLELLKKDKWWQSHFYPTIADGDNEFYGKGQWDWGAGGKLFENIDIADRDGVSMRKNGCEYHSVIHKKGIDIHFIALHYPDQPANDSIAFKEDSKKYLISELKKIDKKDSTIIIVSAHSRFGYWLDRFKYDDRKIINSKADLLLSATTHVFHIFSDNNSDGPLIINTGSITRPRLWCPPGFISVSVYEKQLKISIKYLVCSKDDLKIKNQYYEASKIIGGKVSRF